MIAGSGRRLVVHLGPELGFDRGIALRPGWSMESASVRVFFATFQPTVGVLGGQAPTRGPNLRKGSPVGVRHGAH